MWWANANASPQGLPPVVAPLSRRIYAGAMKTVRWTVRAGLFVMAPVLGAVLLKLILGIASVLFSYALGGLLAGPSFMAAFWETMGRAIPWSISERPSLWWLLAGAVITWPFFRR